MSVNICVSLKKQYYRAALSISINFNKKKQPLTQKLTQILSAMELSTDLLCCLH